jgi:hypothetical protein
MPLLLSAVRQVLRQLLGPAAAATLSAARRYRLRVIRPVVAALISRQELEPAGSDEEEGGAGGGLGLPADVLALSAMAPGGAAASEAVRWGAALFHATSGMSFASVACARRRRGVRVPIRHRACACRLLSNPPQPPPAPASPAAARKQLVASLVADLVLCTKEANKKCVAVRTSGVLETNDS